MSEEKKKASFKAMDPTFIAAGACTVAYYGVVTSPAMHGSLLQKYTAEHAVEYVIVALFFWGIIDIIMKLSAFPREVLSTRQTWLPPRAGRVPVSAAKTLLAQVRAHSAILLKSRIAKRYIAALSFVNDTGSAEDFDEHLRYLGDQDHNHSLTSYTLIRFVIGVTPILGFLGTVVHFGTALGGFSLENSDSMLPSVVSEMGTAFNTTTVALAAAMTMMFALFLCERVERNLLETIDRQVESELSNRFEIKDANMSPFLASIQSANVEALKAITGTLQQQIEVWTQSLDHLFRRFDERQRQEVGAWQGVLEAVQKRLEAHDASREEHLRQVLSIADARQEKQLVQLQTGLDRALSVRETIGELTKTLGGISRGEGRLQELQVALSDNLRVLHETRQIDNAMHGLTAAIHMLTARSRGMSLHDDSAAA